MAQAGHSKSENSMMVSGASAGPLLCVGRRQILGHRPLGVPVVELGIARLDVGGGHGGAGDRSRRELQRAAIAAMPTTMAPPPMSARCEVRTRLAARAEVDLGEAPREDGRDGDQHVGRGAEQAERADREDGEPGHVEREADVPERETEEQQARLGRGRRRPPCRADRAGGRARGSSAGPSRRRESRAACRTRSSARRRSSPSS